MTSCNCGARLRKYAEELVAFGREVGKVDVRGSHAIHDAAHYLHAAKIAEGHEPTVEESTAVKVDTDWLRQGVVKRA